MEGREMIGRIKLKSPVVILWEHCSIGLTCHSQETQMLLDPLPAKRRKGHILTEHGPILLLVRVIERYACPLMRDVETELLGQKERSVVYQSSSQIKNTLHRSKPHVHLHLVRAIVDVVRMEQRIQRRTTIHEVAIAETQISLSRLHSVIKGTA